MKYDSKVIRLIDTKESYEDQYRQDFCEDSHYFELYTKHWTYTQWLLYSARRNLGRGGH